MNNQVFTQVNYRQFRQFMDSITTTVIKGKGYETAIYDNHANIKAIVHAASIDEKGRIHPSEYYIKATALPVHLSYAA
ncbi:hypothetical protein JYU12_02210 [bacterium AH-315-K03]|nr:hypothetical protein [bacterium AH-315-K03]